MTIYHYAVFGADGTTIENIMVIDDQAQPQDFGTLGSFTPFTVQDAENNGWACVGVDDDMTAMIGWTATLAPVVAQLKPGQPLAATALDGTSISIPASNNVTPAAWAITPAADYIPDEGMPPNPAQATPAQPVNPANPKPVQT